MKRRTNLALAGATVLAAGMMAATPVQAATCTSPDDCPTIVTFTLTGGDLTITVPAGPINFTTFTNSPYRYAYGQILTTTPTIEVNDDRAAPAPDAAWTATVTNPTGFVTPPPPGAPTYTIPNTDVYYHSGSATFGPVSNGTGTFSPGQSGAFVPPTSATAPPPAGTSQIGAAGATAFARTGTASGSSAVGWDPYLVVYTNGAIAGSYQGEIDHSVA